MRNMEGKVALVTGSGRGLGRGIVLRMAQLGMDVVINDVIAENAHAVAEEVKSTGRRALVFTEDIADSNAVRSMVERTVAAFGKIDVLVNNAGISPKKSGGKVPVYEITDDEWDLVLAVNLRGSFFCLRETAREMMRVRSGSIVNITSISGRTGNSGPAGAHYSASKAGLVSLTKSAARELAPFNIRVNSVAPGVIDSPMRNLSSAETNRMLKEQIPLGRFATMDEVADAVLFLATDASSYITGATIDVNGGWLMT